MQDNRTDLVDLDEASLEATSAGIAHRAGAARIAGIPMGRRGMLAAALSLGMAGALSACAGNGAGSGSGAGSGNGSGSGSANGAGSSGTGKAPVRVASLKGPTSMGLVVLMQKAGKLSADGIEGEKAATTAKDEKGHGANGAPNKADPNLAHAYEFQMMTAADQIMPAMMKGDLDIVLLPANAASVLYAKSKGGVRCLNINTLGVLSVVTGDSSISTFEDLAGRTVYLTGKGTTPEYVMNYLLGAAGIEESVTLEFKSEPAEVVSVLAVDARAVGVLPQPFVTAAQAKNPALAAPVDLTETWNRLVEDTGSQLLTGVTVARAAFVDENPDAVDEFMRLQAASVEAVNADPAAAAKLVVAAGIVDAEPIAAKAIPACHITCIEGSQMRDALEGYLDVLYNADPASVGGSLPDDAFYYQA